FSDSLESLLYVFHRITQNNWATVWAGHWAFGLSKFSEQPFHLVLLERHVDLDCSVTRNRCRDTVAYGIEIQHLMLALKISQQLAKHLLHVAAFYARWHCLYDDGPGAEQLNLKAIASELI